MFKYIVLSLLTFVFISCAQDMDTIDRTQPDRIDKSMFNSNDEWYMLQTVVDVPYSTGFSFVGEEGDTELIRWRVTEDYLYAHRAHDWIEGSEEFLVEDGNYYGAPVAIFSIQSHFDVQRQYNPATGEETNVIVENSSDRPWYERKYMRVDWSKNLVQDFRFGSVDQIPSNPVSFYVSEMGEDSKDSPIFEDNYIGITGMVFAEPDAYTFSNGETYPACYFYDAMHLDCLGQRIKIRTSFYKKDKSNDYKAQTYNDRQQQKFGFFRTERLKYDRWQGTTYNEKILLINRWNLWERGEMSKDISERATRKIIYHVNDNFPEYLKDSAKKVVCSWNRVMKATTAVAKGETIDFSEEQFDYNNACDPTGISIIDNMEDIIVLCENNPVREGDPTYCGNPGDNPQIGDLRYSFINWVENPQLASPLGYGPSATDSETGEIFRAVANVYGNELDSYVMYIMDLIDLLNGDIELEDYISGAYLKDYIENLDIPVSPTIDSNSIAQSINRYMGRNYNKISSHLKNKDFSTVESLSSRLSRVQGTPMESLLMTEPLKKDAMGYFMDEEGNIPQNYEEFVNPVKIFTPDRIKVQKELDKMLAEKTIFMPHFMDNTMMALAERYKNSTKPKEEIKQEIAKDVFYAVTLHEFGHTVGLRHNYRSARDAFNFFDRYWDIKFDQSDAESDILKPEYLRQPTQEMLKDEGLREYQYTSIMDYLMKPNSDLQGLGTYDYAAIHYGYGDQVMVFDGDGYNPDFYKQALSDDYHYTALPYILKTSFNDSTSSTELKDAMRSRTWKTVEKDNGSLCSFSSQCSGEKKVCSRDGHCVECLENSDCGTDKPFCGENGVCSASVEVPIGYVSDEYVAESWYGFRFSEGADYYEKVKAEAENYHNYYFLRNFKRGSALRNVDFYSYISRVQQKFYYLTTAFKYAVYESFIKRDDPTFIEDPKRGQHFAAGMMASMNFFGKVLQAAEPGLYELNSVGRYVNSKSIIDYDEYQELENSLTNDQALIYPGEGAKYESSFYDGDLGYYYYYKPVIQGVLYDKIFALMFMGDSYFSPQGEDGQSQIKKYAVNYYTIFPAETQKLISAIYAEDPDNYGPYFVRETDNSLTFKTRPSVFMTEQERVDYENENKIFIDPDTQYTARLYAGYSLLGFFNYSWLDVSLYDALRINVKGDGEGYEPDWANLTEYDGTNYDEADYIQVTDPKTRRVYFALKYAQYGDPDTPDYNLGWRMIEQVKDMMDDENIEGWEIDSKFESIDVMRAFFHFYADMF